jgi:predicted peptidase
VRLDYLFSLPSAYDDTPDKKWPLILFLHGAGERGDNLDDLKVNGIPKIVEARDDVPFITVSPQCPENSLWNDHIEALDALLIEVEETYRVDPDRRYLTGLSMGGFGSWFFATLYPDRFAAVVPICGGTWPLYGFPERIKILKNVPIWAFHGAKDPVVPLEASQQLVNVLEAHDGNVRFTVYPEAEHDSWTETYDNPELYDWLLKQRRS